MSSTLKARPADQGRDLPDELKWKLAGRVDQGDTLFDSHDIPYLRGLADCGIPGAKTLIEMIEKHERVTVWLEY